MLRLPLSSRRRNAHSPSPVLLVFQERPCHPCPLPSPALLPLRLPPLEAATPSKKRRKKQPRDATRTPFRLRRPHLPSPLPPPRLQGRRDEASGGGGGGRAPVAAALRALRAPADRSPGVAGGRRGRGGAPAAAAAGDARRGGVHAAGRVHGAHALRLGHLHAGILPHALGRRARLPLPLRRLRHQPLRDLEGHPPLARRRVLRLAQGGVVLPMANIFQASFHTDVKANTKAPTEVYRIRGV
ncbi:hypothetical protein PVAP13_2NG419703 [Panicum virgatum]|uniref:Uncharacterized protein n=1 Tax=Panicum virgatum TaxID=38727 RepID=A0A8T0VNN6_PANVG|nr:hypothetical protein PVAP13_2NG419703 [Panicum virgatum]